MNVQKVFETIQPIFEKYQHEEHIEFEMRLGKFNCGVFDTDVSKEKFEFMMDGLKKYTGWEKILTTNEEVYYRESDNLRISIDEDAEWDSDVIVVGFDLLHGTQSIDAEILEDSFQALLDESSS